MASEHILQMRITQAAKDAERAVKNKDQRAYLRARAEYEKNDALLRELEAARNERAVTELEAKANREGYISYAAFMRSGVPMSVMRARGWANLNNQSGLWRAPKPRHLQAVTSPPAQTPGTKP